MKRLPFGAWPPSSGMPYALAVAGLMLTFSYALMKLAFYKEFKILEPALILLSAYAFFRYGGALRRSFPVIILAASVMVAILAWAGVRASYPELIADTPSPFALARGFAFIFLGFWLASNCERGLVFWGLAAAGLLFTPWSSGGGFQEILDGWDGRRIDFGLQNAQHSGMLFGIVALGMLVFFKRMVMPEWRVMPFRLIIWSGVFGFVAFVVVASQTRAVFLAFAILLTLMVMGGALTLGLRFMNRRRTRTGSSKILGLAAVLSVVIMVVAGVYALSDAGTRLQQRVVSEILTIEAYRMGELEDLERNGTAARLVSWQAALEWIGERPIFGWGHSGGALVMQRTEWLPDGRLRTFGHVHSNYFELLVRYGIVGVSLYVALSIWAGWYAYRGFRSGTMPPDFFVFFCVFFVFWAVVNAFESYMFYWTGVYAFNVVMAVLLGFIWREQHGNGKFALTGVCVPECIEKGANARLTPSKQGDGP